MQRRARRAASIAPLLGLALAALPAPLRAESEQVDVIAVAAGSALVLGGSCAGFAARGEGEVDPEDYARRGALLALAGVYGVDTFGESAFSYSVDGSLGVTGGAGFRCHRFASVEVEAEWLDGFDGTASSGGVPFGQVRIDPVVVTTNVKGYWPMERYQPFLLFGVGAMTADVETRSPGTTFVDGDFETALRFGTGIDVYATPNVVLGIGVDYVLPFGQLEDFSYVSIGWGLQYRF